MQLATISDFDSIIAFYDDVIERTPSRCIRARIITLSNG